YLREVATGKIVHTFPSLPARREGAFAASADGSVLAGHLDAGRIRLWEATSGKELRTLSPQSPAHCLRGSPDGSRGVPNPESGKEISFWDVRTGRETVLGPPEAIWHHSLHFSPDGSLLAALELNPARSRLHVWETGTGKQVRKVEDEVHGINAFAFSPDG